MFSSSSGCRVEAFSPVEEQAREIARSDGRAQANELDRTGAHKELTGAKSGLEKLPTRDEPGRDWQIPLVSGFLIRVMQKSAPHFGGALRSCANNIIQPRQSRDRPRRSLAACM